MQMCDRHTGDSCSDCCISVQLSPLSCTIFNFNSRTAAFTRASFSVPILSKSVVACVRSRHGPIVCVSVSAISHLWNTSLPNPTPLEITLLISAGDLYLQAAAHGLMLSRTRSHFIYRSGEMSVLTCVCHVHVNGQREGDTAHISTRARAASYNQRGPRVSGYWSPGCQHETITHLPTHRPICPGSEGRRHQTRQH